ncbi:MAG TPA: DNA mismatch repair protein MutT [Lentisphaeria bacterium]|nr:DNA mismatch repair protein MutT [Lentisphaeria bacterium]
MIAATLCYVRDLENGRTLMLHRTKKDDDIHEGKWNGLGGKFDPGESPEMCVIRELHEESGLTIVDPELKGLLVFPNFAKGMDWHVFVFVATKFSGELIDCAEGELDWIESDRLTELNLWDGDRVFLPWLDGSRFFSGRLVYEDGKFIGHDVSFYPGD